MKKQKGFSLIELLIVVAIILIIAAIAIPNLLRSRIAANEASAVGSVRTLTTSSITYGMSHGGYAALTLAQLGPANAGLIDQVLVLGSKSGYNFSIPGPTATTFTIIGAPQSSSSGVRYFCAVEDAVIRGGTTAITDAATCTGTTPMN